MRVYEIRNRRFRFNFTLFIFNFSLSFLQFRFFNFSFSIFHFTNSFFRLTFSRSVSQHCEMSFKLIRSIIVSSSRLFQRQFTMMSSIDVGHHPHPILGHCIPLDLWHAGVPNHSAIESLLSVVKF